jgi:hypothetical protein
MDLKFNIHNLPYFDQLPEGYRLATLDDFHIHGRKKIGLEYLIHTFWTKVYELHTVNENTEGKKLLPFFNENRIYIKAKII